MVASRDQVRPEQTADQRQVTLVRGVAFASLCAGTVLLMAAGAAQAAVKVWRVGDVQHPWNVTPVSGIIDWGRGWAVEVLCDYDGDGLVNEDGIELVDNDGDGLFNEDPVDATTGNGEGGFLLDDDKDGLVDEDGPDPQIDNDGDGWLNEDPHFTVGDDDWDGLPTYTEIRDNVGGRYGNEDPVNGLDDDGDGLVDEDDTGINGLSVGEPVERIQFRYDVAGMTVAERQGLRFAWYPDEDQAGGLSEDQPVGGVFKAVKADGDTVVAYPQTVTVRQTSWIRPVRLDSTRNVSQLVGGRWCAGQYGSGTMIVPTRDADVIRREGAEPFMTMAPGPGRSYTPGAREAMFDGDLTTKFSRDANDADSGAGVNLMGYFQLRRVILRPRLAFPDRSPEDYIINYGGPGDIVDNSLRAPKILVPVVEGRPLPVSKDHELNPPVLAGIVYWDSRHPKLFPWEIAEMQLYGEGHAQDAVYYSEIMDVGGASVRVQRYEKLFEKYKASERDQVEAQFPLDEGEQVTWGKVRWQGQRIGQGGDVRIQFRSGNVRDTHVYQRNLGSGIFDPRDEEGNLLDAFGWAKVAPLQRARQSEMPYNTRGEDLGEDGRAGWTYWSAPLKFEDGLVDTTRPLAGQGIAMPVPPQTRYLQFRILFDSTVESTVQLAWLEFEYDVPLVDNGVIAEIFPGTAPVGQDTVLNYFVEPRFLAASDRAFNRLEINVPVASARVESLKVDLPRGGADLVWEELQVPEGVDGAQHLQAADPVLGQFAQAVLVDSATGRPRLSIKLPSLGVEQFPPGGEGTIEVVLRSRLYSGATEFRGIVADDRLMDSLPQLIEPGDVTSQVATDGVTVIAETLDELTGPVEVSPNPFTPNSDGVNDEVSFDFELFLVSVGAEVTVDIHELGGRRVRQIGPVLKSPGGGSVTWDGTDDSGETVPPGIYLYRFVAGSGPSAGECVGMISVAY